VVVVAKRLKVQATCREIWKAVSLVTNWPEEWTYLPPLVIWFFTRTDVREYIPRNGQEYGHVVALQTYVLHIGCAYGPTVACGGPVPRVGMKGKRLLRNDRWMFQACELGLPLQGFGNLIQNRPFLVEIETAYSFYHIE
jgi:hypothetical protein